jgi:hypothetical protein
MLAVISPHSDVETVKILLSNQAKFTIKERGSESNLFHIAALNCVSDEVFKYLIKNVDLDIFERNKAGETVMSLAN